MWLAGQLVKIEGRVVVEADKVGANKYIRVTLSIELEKMKSNLLMEFLTFSLPSIKIFEEP
ncbi:unnamed protein product [Prunus armeniaca]|uniref:Uncharacterized protein n=1 Tax=Prunus armeniaca TaxID=36596 RepID=A0A6J5V054_PRUAR|nr:unnamed protein product [Prunus armeniaca]